MKKYLLVFLLAIFIIPSIAFASWWNPFSWSWFGWFNNTNTTIQPINPPKICPAWGCGPAPLKPISVTSTNQTTLAINSIYPNSGPIGTFVTVIGKGFTATGNKIVANNGANWATVASTNGTSLTFNIPTAKNPDCTSGKACPMYILGVGTPLAPAPGTYILSVVNANGTSNGINFTVTSNTTNAVTRKIGDKELNFLIQKINTNNVDGLLYILYPITISQGQPKTLNIGDTVGYACEGKIATLTGVNTVNQTVTFNEVFTTTPHGNCPI